MRGVYDADKRRLRKNKIKEVMTFGSAWFQAERIVGYFHILQINKHLVLDRYLESNGFQIGGQILFRVGAGQSLYEANNDNKPIGLFSGDFSELLSFFVSCAMQF